MSYEAATSTIVLILVKMLSLVRKYTIIQINMQTYLTQHLAEVFPCMYGLLRVQSYE